MLCYSVDMRIGLCYHYYGKDGECMKKAKIKSNSFTTVEVVFLVIVTCFISFIMAYLICRKSNVTVKYNENNEIYKFIEQYQNIVNNYYGDVDKDKLINGAIKGMIDSLDDPYATYFDENSANNFNIKLNGEFEGFGIEIIKYANEYIQILTVFDNSPASKTGLQVNDKIISINGEDTKNLTTTEFSKIVAASDTKINLVINRNGEEKEVSLNKGKVILSSVSSKMLNTNNKNIGYIKISIFALNTYEQFKDKLNNLEKDGIEGLIIDLRDNSGGHSSTAENILSLFLSNKRVMYQVKDQNKIEKKYSNGSKEKTYPIVVLVNSESASASEIVASALKENVNATLVGNTTYGKGTVQNLIELPSGEQYKYTTKIWLTANGNNINGEGINPDIEVTDDNTLDDIYVDKALQTFEK